MQLIKNGRVIDPKNNRDEICDILIDGQKITAIGQNLAAPKADIIDADGLIIAPGLVDIHVHFREPGQTHKETIHTGSLSAAHGGFTRVVMMANTSPIIDNSETLEFVLNEAKKQAIHVHSVASISKNFDGESLTDMTNLLKQGAVGFSDDGVPLTNAGFVREAMLQAEALGTVLSLHEEDPSLIDNLGINEGAVAHECGIHGAPGISESSMVARDVLLAAETGAKIHFQHLSHHYSVDVIQFGKGLSANITAEATPQHFSLTEAEILTKGTNAKLNPPLRTEADRQKVIEGLKNGVIDVIATDHAPHHQDEKNQAITKAPSGMTGLETALSLGLKYLVEPGYLSLIELIHKMSTRPAEIYQFEEAGSIEVGSLADLVIFDLEERVVSNHFASKSANSPFIGEKLLGNVRYTICEGKIVYENKIESA
ncbi:MULTISPECIES: dihydroorotase [unclassified Enterococcus]|uniref:dihydroorotase n=1 Tax=unclassified Enterococcus TaxID=2608891 RepID=UPI001552C147|nr:MULTISPECIES: dihydroorotase [unclassified Enterococcus]MBS7576645.1 dihydroorotase [Enterococcus sp. MMGLQ5-2]MBS7583868.1 dihydroorotase [Enterococcus sp. MMGLQ5-1]NPD11729.1 dihydroorotase [Enterococcus sp. MMGLQ5-1]NPD36482.1 dihydroorotase [Enterococcus sp. MMGLQ5-2]